MAIKRWWVKAATASGSSHGSLTEVAPTNNSGSLTGTGWTVDTLTSTTLYSLMLFGTKRASTTFTTGAKPASAPGTNDCWRTTDGFGTGKYSGTFAAGNWTVGAMGSSAFTGGANVKFEIRIWRSANADGSSATEITSGAVETSAFPTMDSGNNQVSATFNPGAITLTNEYLFFQVACRINGAGGVSGSDVVFSLWPLVNTSPGIANITTPDFADAAATSVPTFQAAGTAANGVGAISPAWPTHQSGDVALLFVESANEAITLSSAQGFVEITNSPQGTGTGAGTTATRLAVFWCRATSSAMTAPTVADSGDHTDAIIVTFRNCVASGTPYEVSGGDVASTASATVTVPGATTTVNNQLVVLAASNPVDATTDQSYKNWVNANLANIMEVAGENTTQGNGGGINIATGELVTAGAYGSTTCTRLTSTVQGRISVALLPAATGRTGSASVTLDALTSSATGAVAIKGAASPTLDALTATATGAVAIKSSTSATLADLTSAATGAVAIKGTLAVTLEALTATATSKVAIAGAASVTLDDVVASAAGKVAIKSSASATLADATTAATGAVVITGQASATLDDLTGSAAGAVELRGVAAVTLDDLTSSATGEVASDAIHGQAPITLDELVGSGAGALVIKGATSAVLDALTASATGTLAARPAVAGPLQVDAAEALTSTRTIAIALELVDVHSLGAAEALTSTRTIAAALEPVDAETVDATEETISSTRISIQLEVLP